MPAPSLGHGANMEAGIRLASQKSPAHYCVITDACEPAVPIGFRMDLMEHVRRPMVHGVKLQVPGARGRTLEGSMCITAFFLLYSTRKQEELDEITVLHTSIDRLEHKSGTSSAVMFLKDFRKFLFEFPTPEECQDVVDALEVLSQPEWLQQLYTFSYTPHVPLPECRWKFASVQELFARWQCTKERWRISNVNKNFELCLSYPEEVIVPLSSSDQDIKKVASFRHLGRFPVLAFHHKKNQASLVRCGQPLCGPTQKRCKEDVQMLNACLASLSRGKILDIRPQSIAQSHTSKGGGVELPAHYPQWKVEHGKMEPPNIILASLNKLMEACNDPSLMTSSSWFGRLEASGWLNHVTRLLTAAKFVSICIHKDASSVVVHGAGSRDATLQVTSLAQILLDSHCRTVHGFLELIQREWLDGGHPFSLRHTHVLSAPEKEKAPIFLLFIDAVWQVMQQFPLSFEFNERFLHTLFVHSYYSVYGDFLYDTPKERSRQKLAKNTQSLWCYLSQDEVLQPMLNPLYERNSSVLMLTVHTLNVTLWKRLYLRTDIDPSLSLPDHEAIRELKETNTQLKHTLNEVRKQLDAVQAEGRKFASNWS